MGAAAGPSAISGDDLKQRVKATSNGFNQNGYVGVRLGGYNTEVTRVWADIKNDANSAWFCVFTVFRGTSPYVNTAVSATAGGLTTANSRIDVVEGVNTSQNTNITVIQGVDNTQNTNITIATPLTIY